MRDCASPPCPIPVLPPVCRSTLRAADLHARAVVVRKRRRIAAYALPALYQPTAWVPRRLAFFCLAVPRTCGITTMRLPGTPLLVTKLVAFWLPAVHACLVSSKPPQLLLPALRLYRIWVISCAVRVCQRS